MIAATLAPRSHDSAEPSFGLREVMSRARPLLEELLLLWHRDVQIRLVLFVRVDESGGVYVSARMREHDFDPGGPDLARRVRRIRGDVPVVVDVPGSRPLVLRWGSLEPAGAKHLIAGKRKG